LVVAGFFLLNATWLALFMMPDEIPGARLGAGLAIVPMWALLTTLRRVKWSKVVGITTIGVGAVYLIGGGVIAALHNSWQIGFLSLAGAHYFVCLVEGMQIRTRSTGEEAAV
jgi:drug/metabolite transporter (DMT)-like permease